MELARGIRHPGSVVLENLARGEIELRHSARRRIELRVLRVEPAILVVKPEEGTLYAAWVQSQQHARPHFSEVLAAVESMLAHGVPRPRGAA